MESTHDVSMHQVFSFPMCRHPTSHLHPETTAGPSPSQPCPQDQRSSSLENTTALVFTSVAYWGQSVLRSDKSCYCDINHRMYIELIYNISLFRNIWDGSLAVEKIINTGNQTVTIVSMDILDVFLHFRQIFIC